LLYTHREIINNLNIEEFIIDFIKKKKIKLKKLLLSRKKNIYDEKLLYPHLLPLNLRELHTLKNFISPLLIDIVRTVGLNAKTGTFDIKLWKWFYFYYTKLLKMCLFLSSPKPAIHMMYSRIWSVSLSR